jgi:hypothetical protein
MNTLSLLHLFLVLHIIGISLMVGTSVVERFTFGAFRRRLKRGDAASIVLLDHLSRLGVLLGIGAALLVLSGTGMLFLTGGVFVHQGWFKIKLVLVGMLILNGFGFGGRQMARLKKLMQPAVARHPFRHRPPGDVDKGQLVLCPATDDLFGDHWLVGCECVGGTWLLPLVDTGSKKIVL